MKVSISPAAKVWPSRLAATVDRWSLVSMLAFPPPCTCGFSLRCPRGRGSVRSRLPRNSRRTHEGRPTLEQTLRLVLTRSPIRSLKLVPGRPSTSTPRSVARWRRGRRTSPASRSRPGHPRGPRRASGVRSREWSVEGVVGSHPWSPVRTSSPSPAASSSSGRRRSSASIAAAYPPGSLRWPYFESKSTRFVKTRSWPPSRRAVIVRSTPSSLESEYVASVMPRCAKMSWILPIPSTVRPARDEVVEHRRARRRHAVVPPLRSPDEGPRFPVERPRDHPPDAVWTDEQSPGDLAPGVEQLQGHDVLVGGDLEHGIPARVDDRLAGRQVLAPRSAMISVPDAGMLPSTPRPIAAVNGSMISGGNPFG